MHVLKDHWLARTRRLHSPNCNERAETEDVCLLVIHGISLPPGKYGTGMVADLFLNRLDCRGDPSFADLDSVQVSAHLFIDRGGRATQFVPFDKRAWHAGDSNWCGRDGCNDFSIGIEMEGCDTQPYTRAQYRRLKVITLALLAAYPRLSRSAIVGHQEIAPQRKTDPGAMFDWSGYLCSLR